MLTPMEIQMVQGDWQRVLPIASTAANLFYDRLFELDPSVRGLFPADLGDQKRKLMTMIGMAIAKLNDLPALVPVVEDLGRRHVGYGVKPEHYGTVGQALLWTLEKGIGPEFDAAHTSAWSKVYNLLSQTMQKAQGSPSNGLDKPIAGPTHPVANGAG